MHCFLVLGDLFLNIFNLMCLLLLVHLDFASLDGVADTGNIDGPLALVGVPSIAVYAALAPNRAIPILDALGVHLVLIDLPYGLLELLLLGDIVLADFAALVVLVLLKLSQQILQITFGLAVIRVALLTLGYFGIVALEGGPTFICYRGSNGIVSNGIIWVMDASLVFFRGCVLRVLD